MYIGYFNDRQELGFSCSKDIHAVKQLSDFKSILNNPVIWIITKGKQTFILIFSKEVLVAVFIFLKSSYIERNVDWSSFSSSEVYQSCVSKSDTSGFFTAPSRIPDSILKLKGGSDELTIEEQERLGKSIVTKDPQSSYQEISINKFLKKILKLIDPVISDQRLWKILSESGKPIKSELSGPSEVRSKDILGPSQNVPDKQAKTRSKGSSSFFVEALPIPNSRKLLPMQNRVQLNMAKKENNFSNGLTPSGLSLNHKESAEDFQNLEKLTQDRRDTPLLASQSLGEPYYYSEKQLRRKAPRHLTKDFNIPIEGKTPEQQALAYYNVVEKLLKKSDLIVNKKATLNKQEKVEIRLDLKSRLFAAFENKPFYDKNCFISAYKIIPEAVQEFLETGNIGVSPEERKVLKDYDQKAKAAQERIQANKHSFYKNLPEDARIGNKQLSEAEIFKAQLETDPNFQLTDKQKSLLERAERHEHHKQKFYKKNPHISEDEL